MSESRYPTLAADDIDRVSEQFLALVRVRFGVLSSAQLEEVRGRIAAQVAAAEKLHAFPLTNADEPAFALALGPGEAP